MISVEWKEGRRQREDRRMEKGKIYREKSKRRKKMIGRKG
jgi:hypothetical protein